MKSLLLNPCEDQFLIEETIVLNHLEDHTIDKKEQQTVIFSSENLDQQQSILCELCSNPSISEEEV
jgi:hypothetical protein